MTHIPTTSGSFSAKDTIREHLEKQTTQPYPIEDLPRFHLARQATQPQSRIDLPRLSLPYKSPAVVEDTIDADPIQSVEPNKTDNKRTAPLWQRLLAVGLLLILSIALYFIWRPTAPTSNTPPTFSKQDLSTSATKKEQAGNGEGVSSSSATLQVYAVGAVKKPGVYVLAAGSRIYHLLAAAGGPLPNANLVALNLAAPLTDGEEVYVAKVGEAQPSNVGGTPTTKGSSSTSTTDGTDTTQRVNINTASEDEMRQILHVSSTTAKNIINYRTQHGPFTSVEQLLQVISEAIYKRIKDMVTV